MATKITDAMVKRATMLLTYLRTEKKEENPYRYDELASQTYEKDYKYLDYAYKLKQLTDDTVGMISDLYIMYAISVLRAGTIWDISVIIQRLRDTYKEEELLLPSADRDVIKSCLHRLERFGMVYQHGYVLENGPKGKKHYTIYSLDKENLSLLNQALSKNIRGIPYLQVMPLYQIIGLAASGHTMAKLLSHKQFERFGSCVASTKYMNDILMPHEIVLKDAEGERTYIGFRSGYFQKVEGVMTTEDVQRNLHYELNLLRNYVDCRSKTGDVVLVITLDGVESFEVIKEMIEEYNFVDHILPQIYFTSYGLMEKGEYFSLMKKKDGECIAYAVTPSFV